MKKTTLVLFLILWCGATFSQTNIPKHYELEGKAGTQADSILKLWNKKEFPSILKKNKLKMTCAKCSNIYMDVVFTIDANGVLRLPKIVKTVCCAGGFSNDLSTDFLDYFYSLQFPWALRNITFEYRLGTGLSC
jgi:hypothetical protein